MEKKAKIYAGSGKKQNDTWFKASLNFEELVKHVQEFNGKKFVKVNINVGKADKYGKDVSITIDDWKPASNNAVNAAPVNTTQVSNSVDSLPF